jgi:hypothetical protein
MSRMFKIILITLVALAMLGTTGLAQPAPRQFTVTGKISHDQTGYYIQGEKPPEVFTIVNPNKPVLQKLEKSGKSVTIEARSVQGDALFIESVNGEPYKATIK